MKEKIVLLIFGMLSLAACSFLDAYQIELKLNDDTCLPKSKELFVFWDY